MQIALVPRPEDIAFFHGSPENERRRLEFERYHCLSAYYSLHRVAEPDEICRPLLTSVGFYVFNGAFRT